MTSSDLPSYTGAVTIKRRLLQTSCMALLLLAAPALSEHEVFYRFVVLGYVQDAKHAPLKGITVQLTREKTGLSYFAATDAQGFYIIVARLGDESAGERLTVTAEAGATTVIARFDPKNHTDHRGTRVDFGGKKPVELPALFAATLNRFLAR